MIAEDGHTYERAAIARWFARNQTRSPVTNEEIAGPRLIPNLAVRKLVDQYRNDLGRRLLPLIDTGVDRRAVQELLHQGAQANIRDEHGATPILLAVSRGRLDLVHLLVEHGADPSLCNDKGENAVAAARRRRLDVVLITYLADVEKRFASKHAVDADTRARERTENRRTQEALLNERLEANRVFGCAPRSSGSHAACPCTRTGNTLPVVPGIGYFPSLFGLQFQGAISATDVAPVYRGAQDGGGATARALFFVDWVRFLVVGDADLPPGHEDYKTQRLLSRALASLVATLVVLLLVL